MNYISFTCVKQTLIDIYQCTKVYRHVYISSQSMYIPAAEIRFFFWPIESL